MFVVVGVAYAIGATNYGRFARPRAWGRVISPLMLGTLLAILPGGDRQGARGRETEDGDKIGSWA